MMRRNVAHPEPHKTKLGPQWTHTTNGDQHTATAHQDQPKLPRTDRTDKGQPTTMRHNDKPAPYRPGLMHPRTQVTEEDQPTTRIHQIQTTEEARTDDPGERANRASQRAIDPANLKCIKAILEKVSIGTDLTDRERTAVVELICKYPDIFVLSLSEVFPVDFATHKLKLNPDIALPKKVHQQLITEPQCKFFTDIIDDMEKAGVIQAVPAEFIKCLNATTLAPKEAGKDLGMSCEALLHRCNKQCRRYGLLDYWEQTDDNEPLKQTR